MVLFLVCISSTSTVLPIPSKSLKPKFKKKDSYEFPNDSFITLDYFYPSTPFKTVFASGQVQDVIIDLITFQSM